jgi:ParG protein
MKEAVTCWIRKETHNRLKVFCALHGLSMMQVITQAVNEWLEQHGSNLGDEVLQVLQREKPMKRDH